MTWRVKSQRSKYNAKKVAIDGITFDSKAEARRYGELKLMLAAKTIEDLKTHTRFPIVVCDEKICDYEGDFYYFEVGNNGGGHYVVEDVKGCITQVFRLKEKLFRARYPKIELRIIKV